MMGVLGTALRLGYVFDLLVWAEPESSHVRAILRKLFDVRGAACFTMISAQISWRRGVSMPQRALLHSMIRCDHRPR